MKVLLTGGGTGGHVYPALAIAEALGDVAELQPLEFLFVGTRAGLEARVVPKTGVPVAYVHAAPLQRRVSFAIVRTLVDNARGFFEGLAILHRFQPDVAIATGGYVTLPVVAALWIVRLLRLSRARIALLEPNARAGLALSTHGVVLENGTVRLTGSGREVLEHPEIAALYLGGMVSEAKAA